VPSRDWPTFAGAALLFTGVALVACSGPGRRATSIAAVDAL
jgi:hypothetical protein